MRKSLQQQQPQEWCGGVVGRECAFEVDERCAFMVCRECGRTSRARVVDEGAEWRRFEADDITKVRVVARQTDRLAPECDAAAGVLAAGAAAADAGAGAARRAARRGDAMVRVMRTAFATLADLCAALRLSARVLDAAKDAVCEFRDVWLRTRAAGAAVAPRAMPHDEAALCVVLHAVCAADGAPLTYAELAARTHVARTRIAAARRAMLATHPALGRPPRPVSAAAAAAALVARGAAPFALAPADVRRAETLAGRLAAGALEGRPAGVVAAAALYLALKHQPAYALARQNDVADRLAAACFISTKTARATVARLEESPALLARAAALWTQQISSSSSSPSFSPSSAPS